MSLEELKDLELPPLLPDAWLFTWRVASMQAEALELIEAHGFTVKTELVWIKRTVKGKRFFGMGRTLRGEHETCLIATRGRPKIQNKRTRSTFEAKVGRHSAKPPEFFELVEALCPGPYIELFARERRPGWDCYGNELKCQTCEGTGYA
jgi:N6-adenosine-specific RNA methylase IME4